MKLLTMIALLLVTTLTAGCFGGGFSSTPPLPTPTLTPTPQPFRTRTTFVDNVLSIDVRYHDGRTRTLDTVRHYENSWGLYLPRPLQPGHSSREWLLAENHYDGKILLYTVVSWNDDDPADYLAAGWWLVYQAGAPYYAVDYATRGSSSMAPKSTPQDRPLTGTATYVGGSDGLYTYNYGRNWGELAGSSEYTEFAGTISLTADFAGRRISGCLGCSAQIETAPGRHLFPVVPWQGPDPEASPADYDLRFSASFDVKGAFEDTEITITHPERKIT